MQVTFHKQFKKKYAKLRKGDRKQCDSRLLLFAHDPGLFAEKHESSNLTPSKGILFVATIDSKNTRYTMFVYGYQNT